MTNSENQGKIYFKWHEEEDSNVILFSFSFLAAIDCERMSGSSVWVASLWMIKKGEMSQLSWLCVT
jgi:hypothetical protein